MSDKLKARIWRAANARGRFIKPLALDYIAAQAAQVFGNEADDYDAGQISAFLDAQEAQRPEYFETAPAPNMTPEQKLDYGNTLLAKREAESRPELFGRQEYADEKERSAVEGMDAAQKLDWANEKIHQKRAGGK